MQINFIIITAVLYCTPVINIQVYILNTVWRITVRDKTRCSLIILVLDP